MPCQCHSKHNPRVALRVGRAGFITSAHRVRFLHPESAKTAVGVLRQAGLESDEFCVRVTSPPLGVSEAWDALARAVPDLDSYRQRGRIEIIPYTEWLKYGTRMSARSSFVA